MSQTHKIIVPGNEPTPILCAPYVELPHRFAAAPGGSRAMERAVLRPVDLTVSHGLVLKPEHLERMVKTYDPSFEAAMLNFDHQWGGPSHGHCVRLWMDGEFLWARFERLSTEAVAGIENGQWPRCSSEFYPQHPISKDWYFVGLALLGSKYPAVPGLGDARLLSRPIYRLITLDSETRSETAEHAAPANGEETTEETMSKKTEETPAGAETTTTPETPATGGAPVVTPPAPAPDATAAQLAAEVKGEVAALRADRIALAQERAALRLERAETATDKLLATKLEKRLTPIQVKLARPLFVALLAAEAPVAVKLAAADGKPTDVPVLDRLVQILEAGPEHSKLFGSMAAAEPNESGVTALSAAELRAGITPEEAAAIEKKYPSAFADLN